MLLSACAAKPVLNPNAKYNRVGEAHAEQDVDSCMAQADQTLKKTQRRRVLRSAATGAVVGAVGGGLIGSTGHTGTLGGAAIGGIAGGTVGAIIGAASTPEQAKRGLVNYCLKKKGYSVAGWDD